MTSLLLVEHPLSPYAQKIRILLREKDMPFETRMPEGIGMGAASDDLRRLNPRLEVPSLLIDGSAILYDSTIILEYLEEAYPEPALMPKDPLERARMRTIEEVCDTHYEGINWGLIELRYFERGGDLAPLLREVAERDLGHMHAWLERHLKDKPWLSGNQFGWADLAALPYVTMSAMLGITPKAGSPLAEWVTRGCARPSVAKTVEEGLASVAGMEGIAEKLNTGYRRQYRDHRLEWMIRSGGLAIVTEGLVKGNIRFTDLATFSACD